MVESPPPPIWIYAERDFQEKWTPPASLLGGESWIRKYDPNVVFRGLFLPWRTRTVAIGLYEDTRHGIYARYPRVLNTTDGMNEKSPNRRSQEKRSSKSWRLAWDRSACCCSCPAGRQRNPIWAENRGTKLLHFSFAASCFASMHRFSIVNFNAPTLILFVINALLGSAKK